MGTNETRSLRGNDLEILEYINSARVTHITALRLVFTVSRQTMLRSLDRLMSAGYIYRPMSGLIVSVQHTEGNSMWNEWASKQIKYDVTKNYQI